MQRQLVFGYWLGRRTYEPIHWLQQQLQDARIAGDICDTILFVEHESVVTLGRGAKRHNLKLSYEQYMAKGVDLVETGRGGDVTFHGPGQLVCYPIVDLKPDRCDVRKYIRDLAGVMVDIAMYFGLGAGILGEYPGTWVDKASPHVWPGEQQVQIPVKLGAVGVRISRWVTMHGFGFNASTNLNLFRELIVPCGIDEYDITSLSDLGVEPMSLLELAKLGFHYLRQRFEWTNHEFVLLSDQPTQSLTIDLIKSFQSAQL